MPIQIAYLSYCLVMISSYDKAGLGLSPKWFGVGAIVLLGVTRVQMQGLDA